MAIPLTLDFSGPLNPDSTGTFVYDHMSAGYPMFHNIVKEFWLWYFAFPGQWLVSKVQGLPGPYGWSSSDLVSTNYLPYGTALGTGDMH